jgi:hypothetical protein
MLYFFQPEPDGYIQKNNSEGKGEKLKLNFLRRSQNYFYFFVVLFVFIFNCPL